MLQVGFIHLEGAKAPGNEKQSFLSTKLEALLKAKRQIVESKLLGSLQKLGLHYVNTYTVHKHTRPVIMHVWQKVIEVKELGLMKLKSIGVRTFNKLQIMALLDAEIEAVIVNQIEHRPLVYPLATSRL
ncbi:hypothetical protein BDV98DRAFT_597094 [Pterulicium gracile]|uniref:NADP-dependent oxidoreductase domain-containing protein n=1 Tax=Pterulicium gracile TaxID=1884261 RepID=A0A5C3Q660_9AGAR|nr:hypothetical protein BDV98DRAFT_597094 [Pterula gracilis]